MGRGFGWGLLLCIGCMVVVLHGIGMMDSACAF